MKEDKEITDRYFKPIYDYLQPKKKQELELKPKEHKNQDKSFYEMSTLAADRLEKYKNSSVLKENKIVCQNIIIKFFELDDKKFMACLNRIMSWGFDIFFREFILNYYLYIKKNNRLRQYILINLDSIIHMLKNELEIDLLNSLKNLNFENYKSYQEVEFLKNDLRNREAALLQLKADKFNEQAPPSEEKKEILSNAEKKNLRIEIRNRLRYENPKLEEDL